MPLGGENEDETQAGGDGHCCQWPQRGSSGRRCCISHFGATSTLAISINRVGWSGGHKPDSSQCLDEWEVRKKEEMLCMSRPFGLSGAPQRTASEGSRLAQCWLTRTRACLCASASTARECCSPAGSLTSLLKEKERGQVGLRHCSRQPELPYSLTPFPTVFHDAQKILINSVPSLDPWADSRPRLCLKGQCLHADFYYH